MPLGGPKPETAGEKVPLNDYAEERQNARERDDEVRDYLRWRDEKKGPVPTAPQPAPGNQIADATPTGTGRLMIDPARVQSMVDTAGGVFKSIVDKVKRFQENPTPENSFDIASTLAGMGGPVAVKGAAGAVGGRLTSGGKLLLRDDIQKMIKEGALKGQNDKVIAENVRERLAPLMKEGDTITDRMITGHRQRMTGVVKQSTSKEFREPTEGAIRDLWQTIDKHNGKMSQVAKELNLSMATLSAKMRDPRWARPRDMMD